MWKIIAICTGIVIGLIILTVGIWYETRYKKKRSLLPRIVVSKEKFFKKTGNIPEDGIGNFTLDRQSSSSQFTWMLCQIFIFLSFYGQIKNLFLVFLLN